MTIRNTGAADLTLTSAPSIGGLNPAYFVITSNTCDPATPVAPSATCGISVAFKPTARGARAGTLIVNSNATNNPQNIALAGTGIAPIIGVSPTSVSISVKAGRSGSATVKISNTGTAGLHFLVTDIELPVGSGTFTVNKSGCSAFGAGTAGLAPTKSCNITVTFSAPAAAVGTSTAMLCVDSDDPVTPVLQVKLTGTAR